MLFKVILNISEGIKSLIMKENKYNFKKFLQVGDLDRPNISYLKIHIKFF